MWILGLVLVVAVLVAVVVWVRWRMARHAPPPEVAADDPGPPPDRDTTWDPRERYDD